MNYNNINIEQWQRQQQHQQQLYPSTHQLTSVCVDARQSTGMPYPQHYLPNNGNNTLCSPIPPPPPPRLITAGQQQQQQQCFGIYGVPPPPPPPNYQGSYHPGHAVFTTGAIPPHPPLRPHRHPPPPCRPKRSLHSNSTSGDNKHLQKHHRDKNKKSRTDLNTPKPFSSQSTHTTDRKTSSSFGHDKATNFSNGQKQGFKTVTVSVPGCQTQRFQVCVGNHPDDVRMWIDERRNHYPTRRRIFEKSLQQRHTNDGTTTTTQHTNNDKVDNEDAIKQPTNKHVNSENALSSLMAEYDSSDDDDEHTEPPLKDDTLPTDENSSITDNTNTINNSVVVAVQNKEATTTNDDVVSYDKTRKCRYFMRHGTCRNGDQCSFLHERRCTEERTRDEERFKHHDTGRNNDHHKRRQPSLLQKLLEQERKRERSVTLQLLRFIVDANFLQT